MGEVLGGMFYQVALSHLESYINNQRFSPRIESWDMPQANAPRGEGSFIQVRVFSFQPIVKNFDIIAVVEARHESGSLRQNKTLQSNRLAKCRKFQRAILLQR